VSRNRTAWAKRKADMVPHVDTLERLATGHRVMLDLGVRTGVSTWALLDAAPDDGEVWSVDITGHQAPARVTGDHRWRFINGDDTADTTWDQLPSRVDFVFLDTSHEYPHTLQELERVAALAPSTIAMHDWNLQPVKQSVEEFLQSHPEWRIGGIEESKWGMVWLTR
jgi:predicted O-methyltransferase YrrM